MKNRPSPLTLITTVAVIVFAVSLIPIFYAAFYAHPVLDDFGYSHYAKTAITEGGSIFDALSGAFHQVKESYYTWQGTFSAILIFSLQPATFGDGLYFLTTFIMVGALCGSTWFFFDTVFVKWFGSKKVYAILTATLTLFCSIQFMPSISEGLYWFNGSSYYTVFYSLSLVYFSLLIRLHLSNSRISRCLSLAFCLLLAVFIGGGNYTTALLTTCITVLVAVAATMKKVPGFYLYYIIFGFLLIALGISMLAPGNSIRGSSASGLGPVTAVCKSITEAAGYIGRWTSLPQIALFAFLTPILVRTARETSFKFPLPFVAFILSFLCYATQFTPSLFAMNNVGAGRQVNIYYYAYYIFVLFNIFYIGGWLANKKITLSEVNATPATSICVLLAIVLLFTAGCLGNGISNMTSIVTFDTVISGEAYSYEEDYKVIIQKIKNGEDNVGNITHQTRIYHNLYFDTDPNFWTNVQAANYFGVKRFSAG